MPKLRLFDAMKHLHGLEIAHCDLSLECLGYVGSIQMIYNIYIYMIYYSLSFVGRGLSIQPAHAVASRNILLMTNDEGNLQIKLIDFGMAAIQQHRIAAS